MDIKQQPNPDTDRLSRWTLIRDVAVFQVKLLVDGLRDLLLVPVSLLTGLVSLLKGGAEPGPEFYDLLRFGRQSERWINLFGAAERIHGPAEDDESLPAQDIDRLMARVESFIVDEYQSGGVTAQAKNRLDSAIDSLTRTAGRNKDSGSK